MAKKKHAPPAFQYYPDDFEQGTSSFTLEEVGAYTRLLNRQWATGSVPGDDVRALSRILRCSVKTAGLVWRTIQIKFANTSDGLYQNLRLEKERKKQLAFRRKQRMNGRLGGRPRKNPGLPFGFPNSKPKKSSPSSSSDLKDQPPPVPPRSAEGVEVSRKPPTRSEREFAEDLLARRSRAHMPSCPHDPPCDVSVTCVGRIVQEKRLFEATGQHLALDRVRAS